MPEQPREGHLREGGGGERTIDLPPPRSRWPGLRLAAAAVLVALGVWAVASGQFRREGEGGGGWGGGRVSNLRLSDAAVAEGRTKKEPAAAAAAKAIRQHLIADRSQLVISKFSFAFLWRARPARDSLLLQR